MSTENEAVPVPAMTDKEDKLYQADDDYKTSQGDAQSDDKAGTRVVQKHKKRLLVTAFTALMCYMFVLQATTSVTSQYLYQRIAHDYYNVTNDTRTTVPCSRDDVNDTMADTRDRIQADVSRLTIFLSCTTFIPTLFLCLFMGSYSDYLGRRILVLMSLSGSFLKALMSMLVVWLNLNLNYLYLAYLLDGLCGTVFGLEMGLGAATADVTITMNEFALTLALLEGSLAISGALSKISVGFLIRYVGFIGPVILCFVVSAIACVIVLFFMPETLRRPVQVTLNPLVHLRKVLGFYILEGSSVQKSLFWCGLLVSILLSFCQDGQGVIEILYMLNAPLCWDSVKLGLFVGVRQFATIITGIVTLKVLQRYASHVTIGIVALFSGAASFSLEAFASADWMMYLTPVLGLAYSCTTPIVKTLMSNMTTADRQGAVFSSIAVVTTVCYLTSTAIVNTLYTSSLGTFPGAVFLLLAAFCIVSMVLLLVFKVVSSWEFRDGLKAPSVYDYAEDEKSPLLNTPNSRNDYF